MDHALVVVGYNMDNSPPFWWVPFSAKELAVLLTSALCLCCQQCMAAVGAGIMPGFLPPARLMLMQDLEEQLEQGVG